MFISAYLYLTVSNRKHGATAIGNSFHFNVNKNHLRES